MASPFYWLRYLFTKANASASTSIKSYQAGQISGKQFLDRLWKDIFQERMTFFRTMKGEEMEPTFNAKGETLLVRKIPSPCPRSVFVGDVVVLKDPLNPEQERVRRVAAIEGDKMVSTDETDIPFELEQGSCWVVCDNTSVNPRNAADSRTFGPVSMSNIIGRAIYTGRSSLDHGLVANSEEAMRQDSPILAVELDIEELSQNTKA